MPIKLFSVCFTFSIIGWSQAVLAPFITKCKAEDSKCLMDNAAVVIPIFAAGVPELGVEPMDPTFFKQLNLNKPNLKCTISNFTMIGLKDCKPVDIHRDVPNSKLYVKASCSVNGHGQYELSGKLLALDINGHGPIKFIIPRFEISLDIDVEVVEGKDKKKHYKIRKYQYTFELFDKSDIIMENLFENNQALSDAASDVIKNGGNDIVKDIGKPVFDATTVKIIRDIGNFVATVPMEELTLDV